VNEHSVNAYVRFTYTSVLAVAT